MNKTAMAAAFNEWMRRFIEDPAKFEAEFQTVVSFTAAKLAGREPDYGERCTALLFRLSAELNGGKKRRS